MGTQGWPAVLPGQSTHCSYTYSGRWCLEVLFGDKKRWKDIHTFVCVDLCVQVEGALSRLLDMANQDSNNVPVLLAMATGEHELGYTGRP